jgi:hypothetical protein
MMILEKMMTSQLQFVHQPNLLLLLLFQQVRRVVRKVRRVVRKAVRKVRKRERVNVLCKQLARKEERKEEREVARKETETYARMDHPWARREERKVAKRKVRVAKRDAFYRLVRRKAKK